MGFSDRTLQAGILAQRPAAPTRLYAQTNGTNYTVGSAPRLTMIVPIFCTFSDEMALHHNPSVVIAVRCSIREARIEKTPGQV